MTLRKNDDRGGEEIDTETSINLKERKRKEAKDKINSSRLKLDENERKGREKNILLSSFHIKLKLQSLLLSLNCSYI